MLHTDTTEYINLRDNLLSKINETSGKGNRKAVVRTRKHPNEWVDSKVFNLIYQDVRVYAKAHVPEAIIDDAYIMQAAQVCYDEATRKQKHRSAWKRNIKSKISKLAPFKDLFVRSFRQKKLTA